MVQNFTLLKCLFIIFFFNHLFSMFNYLHLSTLNDELETTETSFDYNCRFVSSI